jgi:hypothetical protein
MDNGYDNLVWAPSYWQHTKNDPAPNPLNTNRPISYAQSVFERIDAVAKTKAAVKQELVNIANDFIRGRW